MKSLRGTAVRPTADRVKEALFSIVSSRFDLRDAEVLDMFAGTGALGIEALSRGAQRVTFVEPHGPTLALLRGNVEACRFADRAELLRCDADRALQQLAARGAQFDGIVADHPYGRALLDPLLERASASGVLRRPGWLVVEHHLDEVPRDAYGALRLTRSRRYGKTALSLFEIDDSERVTA